MIPTIETIIYALNFHNKVLEFTQKKPDGCLCLIGRENYKEIMKGIRGQIGKEKFSIFMNRLREESGDDGNFWECDWDEGVYGRNCYRIKKFIEILKEFY